MENISGLRNFAHTPYMGNDFHSCNILCINFRMSECNSGSKVLDSLYIALVITYLITSYEPVMMLLILT